MAFIYPTTDFDLSGKILLIPIVSTGNIAQLAIDLLIATLSLQRVAILDPGFCVPVVGGREDGLKGVTTPLELFSKPGTDIIVIQQRSPVLKVRKQEYVKSLLQFIDSSHFSAVLFLSGVDMSNRTDSQMLTPIFQIRPLATQLRKGSPLENLEVLPIPIYTSPVLQRPQTELDDTQIPFIPGGGLTRRILSSLSQGWSTPTGCLIQFVIEGDNRADAHLLATVVSKVLSLPVQEWQQPTSWKVGLFGAPHDQTLYG